jgi:hypothetical protein
MESLFRILASVSTSGSLQSERVNNNNLTWTGAFLYYGAYGNDVWADVFVVNMSMLHRGGQNVNGEGMENILVVRFLSKQ